MTHPPILGTLESALYVPDLAAAEAFYGDLIGLPVVTRAEGRHVFFRVGEGVLLVFNPAETEVPGGNPDLPVPPHGMRGQGHYCFAVPPEALDLWRQRMEAGASRSRRTFTGRTARARSMSAIRAAIRSSSPIPRSGPDRSRSANGGPQRPRRR